MFQAKFLLLAVVAALATAEYKIESRIVQGQPAARGQFPYYVFLEIQLPQGATTCGGSLISDQWVLTAAHCLKNALEAKVHLGALRAMDPTEKGRVTYDIYTEDMHVHPKFPQKLFAWNDIGLIKLPERVAFSDVIKSISFACSSTSGIIGGVDVIAIGNGITKDSDVSLPKILQYTELKTASILSCLRSFPFLVLRSGYVCVKGKEQRSACHGDSGGPLITSDKSLMGLTSFGSPRGCQVGAPQVFTRISKYTSWIKEVSGVQCKK